MILNGSKNIVLGIDRNDKDRAITMIIINLPRRIPISTPPDSKISTFFHPVEIAVIENAHRSKPLLVLLTAGDSSQLLLPILLSL